MAKLSLPLYVKRSRSDYMTKVLPKRQFEAWRPSSGLRVAQAEKARLTEKSVSRRRARGQTSKQGRKVEDTLPHSSSPRRGQSANHRNNGVNFKNFRARTVSNKIPSYR